MRVPLLFLLQLQAIATYPSSVGFISTSGRNLSDFVEWSIRRSCLEVKNINASCGNGQNMHASV